MQLTSIGNSNASMVIVSSVAQAVLVWHYLYQLYWHLKVDHAGMFYFHFIASSFVL